MVWLWHPPTCGCAVVIDAASSDWSKGRLLRSHTFADRGIGEQHTTPCAAHAYLADQLPRLLATLHAEQRTVNLATRAAADALVVDDAELMVAFSTDRAAIGIRCWSRAVSDAEIGLAQAEIDALRLPLRAEMVR